MLNIISAQQNITNKECLHDMPLLVRLQLPLPWKDGYPVDMPQSLPIAMRRLRLQSSKLAKQLEVAQKYLETFENIKKKGMLKA